MSVSGWGGWSERECRPARRAGGTPVQETGGVPAKPRVPLAHRDPGHVDVLRRPARRAGGTPLQEAGGVPTKPRVPLAHRDPGHVDVLRERDAGRRRVWRESAQRTTARPQAIHTPQTPRSVSQNL